MARPLLRQESALRGISPGAQPLKEQDPEPRGLQLPDTRVAREIVHDWVELAACALIPALFIARSSRDIQLRLEAKESLE
ncbi:hypothetical protein RRG08_008711 [Elysia crispata]|uniref:Uncharacterized protein n=1 Tax=Elysia crispata TaxID=231223 RepID=A0AAE1CK76_9GAST|nr:hypothetical protein RRG08_008711 [Elysia crispata]